VVARNDVVNQGRRLGGGGGQVVAHQGFQFGDQGVGIQALGRTSVHQTHLPPTTEVQLQTTEYGGGARQGHGDLSERLLGEIGRKRGDWGQRMWRVNGVHGGSLKIHSTCIF